MDLTEVQIMTPELLRCAFISIGHMNQGAILPKPTKEGWLHSGISVTLVQFRLMPTILQDNKRKIPRSPENIRQQFQKSRRFDRKIQKYSRTKTLQHANVKYRIKPK